MPFEIQNMELTPKGFLFTFTQPVESKFAQDKKNWPFSRYFFEYRRAYGSPRSDEMPVEIKEISISEDGRQVEIELSELKAWHIHEVKIQNLISQTGEKFIQQLYCLHAQSTSRQHSTRSTTG